MKKSVIIFVIGPISSGKSTVSHLIKNAVKIDIDNVYSDYINGRDFREAYADKKFQETCWNDFYKRIKYNKLKNKLVIAQTTGTNPKFVRIVSKLKKEFPKQVYIILLKARKETILNRTKQREKHKRNLSSVLRVYAKIKALKIKYNFIIQTDQNMKNLKTSVDDILKVINSKENK